MTTRDVSEIHEKAVAKALKMARTANSGATAFSKGDVVSQDVIVECKTKMSEVSSFTIYKDWLDTLEEERIGTGKQICALAFSYDVGKHSYYVIDEKTMKRLLETLEVTE